MGVVVRLPALPRAAPPRGRARRQPAAEPEGPPPMQIVDLRSRLAGWIEAGCRPVVRRLVRPPRAPLHTNALVSLAATGGRGRPELGAAHPAVAGAPGPSSATGSRAKIGLNHTRAPRGDVRPPSSLASPRSTHATASPRCSAPRCAAPRPAPPPARRPYPLPPRSPPAAASAPQPSASRTPPSACSTPPATPRRSPSRTSSTSRPSRPATRRPELGAPTVGAGRQDRRGDVQPDLPPRRRQGQPPKGRAKVAGARGRRRRLLLRLVGAAARESKASLFNPPPPPPPRAPTHAR